MSDDAVGTVVRALTDAKYDQDLKEKHLALEERRLEMARTQHEDWLHNEDRSHEAWLELNNKVVAVWERMATALEALVSK